MDGSLSDVNPGLLELSKDTEAWKEQRRQAMRKKIFGGTTGSTTHSEGPSQQGGVPPPMPIWNNEAGPSAAEVSAQEAFILQELMNRKRRREAEAASIATTPQAPNTTSMPSLRDKLLQKYK